MRAVAEQARASSGFDIDDIAHIDFYSCFPSAVQLAADAYGIAPTDARPLTVTGGLAYAGGPGNNYVTHAIATMIERLRDNPGDIGLCTGLGWHVTKHSAGIYSTRPPVSDVAPVDGSADQAAIDAAPHPSVEAQPDGTAVIEAYTVAYGRDGEPEVARCLARLGAERRAVVSSSETAVITALTEGEWYGRSIAVTPDGRIGLLD
jgi:acetyl-CoA C-acetyltransferase